MTKRELVTEVSEQMGFTQNEVSDVVQATLDTITETLAEGQRLEIRNFGVFEHKVREARIGRNPRTGDTVEIESKRVVVFKPGKQLKEFVQNRTPSNGPRASESSGEPARPVPMPPPHDGQ